MKYKLRKVVKEYTGSGKVLKDVTVRWELLECGHSVRYHDPKTTGEKIRKVSNTLVRRCKECGV